jgi:hypothetical protein
MCEIDGLRSKPKGTCEATTFSTHEVWLPVPNYPMYEVSNMGGLRRLTSIDALGRIQKLRYLKGRATSRIGVRVALYNHGAKDFILARLVATTFYGYDINTPLTVNHIDGNRYNNDINNLELVTREENNTHAHDYGLMDAKYKTTILRDTFTNNRLYFKSQTEASKFLGRNTSFIANSKRDGRLQYGQYILEV